MFWCSVDLVVIGFDGKFLLPRGLWSLVVLTFVEVVCRILRLIFGLVCFRTHEGFVPDIDYAVIIGNGFPSSWSLV